MNELIRKKDALDALMAERKHLLANGQNGAEHVLTHHGYNVIDELPPVQSGVPDMNVGDMIYRRDAIDAIHEDAEWLAAQGSDWQVARMERDKSILKSLPAVQIEITHEQAIDYLNKTGWMQTHDKILTKSKIVPSAQPDVPDTNVGDMISKQAATTIPVMPKEHRHYQTNNLDDAYEQGWTDLQECIENMPSVQSNHNAEVSKMVDDAISRHAAIDAVLDRMNIEKYGRDAKPEEIRWTLEKLPPVQQTNEMLERCRFEYIHACKVVSIPTPDVTRKDIQDAYAVIKALQPIFGDVPFAKVKRGDSDAAD